MTNKKDIWKSRYYLILRTYMTISGTWPYRRLCDRYIHFIPTFIFSSSILIPQIMYVISGGDINNMIEGTTAAMISVIFSYKVATVMFSKNVSDPKLNFIFVTYNRVNSSQNCQFNEKRKPA
ncbi:hypothetical protein PUN28_010772 [Cardiocondyla obscurior]|uniref:Uncharacterized protein n=1 Tax=Cardiocondyla obscurior TaxID=286306 RepID=A0AAW2FLC0_9HYME